MGNRVLDSVDELRGLDKAGVLAFAESRHDTRLQADRELLTAAYRWAVLHNPDALAPFDTTAHTHAVPAGAVGTPKITQYAAASFGARIQTSPYGARKLIADAVDLVHRLQKLAAGIDAGTVRVGHARHVAAATRDLSAEEAAWVDNEVVDSADGRLGWWRFKALVAAKVIAAAPEAAAEKERTRATEHGISMPQANHHGTASLTITADLATIASLHHTAITGAAELEESMPGSTLGQRQVAALVNKAGVQAPRTKLYFHLAPDSDVVRVEDHGPLTVAYVRHLLARHLNDLTATAVRVQPVIDLNKTIAVDAYEIPNRLREAVHLIHPADVFPYAANTTRKVDLDHGIPHADGGPTSTENLAPVTRTHHRIKTHHSENRRRWEVRHPFPGITIWRDPLGAHYLVDPTGTRRVTPTGSDQSPTPAEVHFTELALNYASSGQAG